MLRFVSTEIWLNLFPALVSVLMIDADLSMVLDTVVSVLIVLETDGVTRFFFGQIRRLIRRHLIASLSKNGYFSLSNFHTFGLQTKMMNT